MKNAAGSVRLDVKLLEGLKKDLAENAALRVKVGVLGDSDRLANGREVDAGEMKARLKAQIKKNDKYHRFGPGSAERIDNPNEPAGTDNASIGFENEFGVAWKRVPARSFIRMPLQTRLGDKVKALGNSGWIDLIAKKGLRTGLKVLGIVGENTIQEAFATRGWGTWAPNSTLTVALKGSDAPLIDTAQLRQSITSAVGKGTS